MLLQKMRKKYDYKSIHIRYRENTEKGRKIQDIIGFSGGLEGSALGDWMINNFDMVVEHRNRKLAQKIQLEKELRGEI